EFRVLKLQPRDITLVIIVGQQSFGTQTQEAGKSFVRAQSGSFAERSYCAGEPRFVFHVIWNRNQIRSLPLHYSKRAVNLRFLLWMLRDIGFDLLSRDAGGIECAAGIKRIAADERLVVFQQIVAAAVNHEKTADLLVHHLVAAQQTLIQLQTFGIALPPVDALQKL